MASYVLKCPFYALRGLSRMSLEPFIPFRRTFSRRQASLSESPALPEALPLDVPVDEEVIPGYNPKYFYHPNPGDILDHKYELKAKIGWGTSSTVWLAQDLSR